MKLGQAAQRTFPQWFTTDPVFEQGFVFLVVNPDSDSLQLSILDSKHKENEIANAVIKVADIIKRENMEMKKQPIPLRVRQLASCENFFLVYNLTFTGQPRNGQHCHFMQRADSEAAREERQSGQGAGGGGSEGKGGAQEGGRKAEAEM